MKKIVLLFIFPALLLAGCSKWLDVKPKTQVEASRLLTTESGFQDAMYGVYGIMATNSLYGDQLTMSFLDVLAQRYSTISGHDFYQAGQYNYEDAGVKTRITNIWDTAYYAIANLNNIINQVDAHQDVFLPGNYALLKGEAYGLRAFLHFDLLRMFGASYVTDPTRPAIPYVKAVSGNITQLSSVTAVLDSVIADLNMALPLLAGNKDIIVPTPAAPINTNDWLNSRQYHFNYWAAEALLARAYLYKGDKANALQHAQNVINSGKFTFITSSAITSMHDRLFVNEEIFSLSRYDLQKKVGAYFQGTGIAGDNNNQYTRLTNTYGNGGVVDKVFETGSGGATDYRYAYLWGSSVGMYYPSKYWQDASSAWGYLNNHVPLLRISEMYYIAAECSDPLTATDYLNKVRENRGLKDLAAMQDDVTKQNEIFKEYQKEFWCEGQLFYYYKRTNAAQIQYTTTPGSDKVYILPLPDDEIQFGNR